MALTKLGLFARPSLGKDKNSLVNENFKVEIVIIHVARSNEHSLHNLVTV